MSEDFVDGKLLLIQVSRKIKDLMASTFDGVASHVK